MEKIDFPPGRIRGTIPRLPLEASIDLTYRCNNNCRHCWILAADTDEERRRELSTEEWFAIIDQARAMGARDWAVSGGEPMLREDFGALFEYIQKKAAYCSLNTNGTLITPAIAKRIRKDCNVMVSVYGASAQVHDHITRNPGSFAATMRGISYLQEAGVHPIVQLVPMRDNFHQWPEMKALAQSLCPDWRLGAAHLILSASGSEAKNEEIQAQRLTPVQIINLSPPNVPYEERQAKAVPSPKTTDQRKYSHCISQRHAFHVDPTGSLSFCCFIKDERLRYDLKKGTFAEGWEAFIPALSEKDQDCLVFDQKCMACELKNDCQRCPAMNYLEQRQATVPSAYLCQHLKEKEKYRKNWKARHRRYFQIAGITIEVNSERDFMDDTFSPAINRFAVDEPGSDLIQLECFFSLPVWSEKSLGRRVYERAPWLIYQREGAWSYLGYTENNGIKNVHRLAVFSNGYAHGRIFMNSDYHFSQGGMNSLAMFPTDQVWLAPVLLPRRAFYVHSCGLVVDGHGLLFVGHSQAGKSTMAKLFGDQAELLCDDRNIVRFWPEQGWHVHGTWSHGELARVSPSSAPLKSIFFLEKSKENALIPIVDRMEIRKRLIPCLPRPFVNVAWWESIWPMVSGIASEIPAYVLRFDQSGAIVPLIHELISARMPKKAGQGRVLARE